MNEFGETGGGSFKDDEKMPLFSNREGELAIHYLDIAIDIAEARKRGMHSIMVDGQDVSLAAAQKERDARHRAFMDNVAAETREQDPGASEARIRQRAKDILHAMSDTGYISEVYR